MPWLVNVFQIRGDGGVRERPSWSLFIMISLTRTKEVGLQATRLAQPCVPVRNPVRGGALICRRRNASWGIAVAFVWIRISSGIFNGYSYRRRGGSKMRAGWMVVSGTRNEGPCEGFMLFQIPFCPTLLEMGDLLRIFRKARGLLCKG